MYVLFLHVLFLFFYIHVDSGWLSLVLGGTEKIHLSLSFFFVVLSGSGWLVMFFLCLLVVVGGCWCFFCCCCN